MSYDLQIPSLAKVAAMALAMGGFIFLVCVGAQWVVYESLLDDPGGMRLISPCIAAVATAVLAFQLRWLERARAQATQRRFAMIGEMNHHIRNALQVISYQAYTETENDRRRMLDAVERIEWVLRDVLPNVTDEPTTAANEQHVART